MTTPALVGTDWLADHLADPTLRVLDATIQLVPPAEEGQDWSVAPGRDAHDAEHVPGAQYADLISDFSDPGPFPRPSRERVEAALGRLGVGADTHVVVYDRAGTIWAARLWWVLRSWGVDSVSVLDGGFAAWQAAGLPTTSEPTVVEATTPPPLEDRGDLFVDRDAVLDVVEHGGATLVNALGVEDFTARETISYARAGRIPGSLNVPAGSLVGDDGRFLPVEQLRERFAAVTEREGRKITYCGGGIAAASDALALTLLGERDVAIYDASSRHLRSRARRRAARGRVAHGPGDERLRPAQRRRERPAHGRRDGAVLRDGRA